MGEIYKFWQKYGENLSLCGNRGECPICIIELGGMNAPAFSNSYCFTHNCFLPLAPT